MPGCTAGKVSVIAAPRLHANASRPITTASVRRLPHLGATELEILQRVVASPHGDNPLQIGRRLMVTRVAADSRQSQAFCVSMLRAVGRPSGGPLIP